MKPDRHAQVVQERMRRRPEYRRTFLETGERIDLAMLVREMREFARLTQKELADRIGTTQSVIARLEDAEYEGQSLSMLERIAPACGIDLSLHAEGKKSGFTRDVPLVAAAAAR
jgi:transcriptional regulator with XRE-family HTH domain